MRISARADYAVRAVVELAALGASQEAPVKADRVAAGQGIPLKFLKNVLLDLKRVGIVRSTRGVEGGYHLGRPAEAITIADVIRAVDGPLAHVRDLRPEELRYEGAAAPLRDLWVAVRANLRAVLEAVTVADIVRGELPPEVTALTGGPDAWQARIEAYPFGWRREASARDEG